MGEFKAYIVVDYPLLFSFSFLTLMGHSQGKVNVVLFISHCKSIVLLKTR